THYLSGRCKRVIAVEKDPRIVGVLRTQLKNLTNVTIISGDVLNASFSDFDKVVSIPPYYLSSSLLVWLFNRNFECSVLILQKEFGDRLVAPIGTENYGWLTVFAYFNAEITLLDPVPRSAFFPQPTVNSVIVLLKPRKESQFELRDSSIFKQMVRSLFAQRNKKVVNALIPFLKNTLHRSSEETEQIAQVIPFLDQRVRTLPPENFGVLANAIIN
ncbi:hypothetical protein KAI12_03420, partial [Candidatus Bathyarchaeota archaeon]|nr:hypothetical protein [Candidatus Bathyarchaeota archaeon]